MLKFQKNKLIGGGVVLTVGFVLVSIHTYSIQAIYSSASQPLHLPKQTAANHSRTDVSDLISSRYKNIAHTGNGKPLPESYAKLIDNSNSQIKVADISSSDVIYTISNPKHWAPDWALNDNIGDVLAARWTAIMERCKELSSYRNPWRGGPKSMIVQGHNLSFCTTAKGGSTFWKYFMQIYSNYVYERLDPPSPPSTRFVVIRNPWHRLVSAWNEKIVSSENSTFWMKVMCLGKTWPKAPTFSEFVEHCVIRKHKYKSFDNHWVPVIDRCGICQPYKHVDLFIAAENMNVESIYMLKTYGGLRDPQPTLDLARKWSMRETEQRKDTSTYQSHYLNVNKKNMKRLQAIYKYEIYLFQYPDTPFVDFKKS